MNKPLDLFEKNQKWAENIKNTDPEFFTRLSKQQTPEYLWIGCADSRVPATQIVDLPPGEIFVHRNIANLVIQTDLNLLSVLQYAVEVLKVKHVVVCGHYGCGGVKAAMTNDEYGLIDNWLRNIKEVYIQNEEELNGLKEENQKVNRLCELNVIQQVENVSKTSIIQKAWKNGQDIAVHGWIYGLEDGILHDLKVTRTGLAETHSMYHFYK